MRRAQLLVALLVGCGLVSNVLATQEQPEAKTFVTAKSLDKRAPKAQVDAITQQAIDDAAAAAVIGALATQLHDDNVQFKLGDLDSSRASLRDVALDGRGLVKLEGATTWLPIRFQALYDTDVQTVESPSITFEPGNGKAPLAKSLATQLDRAVDQALAREFASQPARFLRGRARVVGGDARYALVQGEGIADFATEGRSGISVQAIYDRQAGRWVDVQYQLGDASVDDARALATR